MGEIRVRTSGAQPVTALARRFERAGARLQPRLTGAVQQRSNFALAEVRAAWLGVEVSSTRGGGSSSGLRRRVAAATHSTPIPNGARIEVEPSEVDPAYGRTLAYGLDGLGRWRHPVWGNTDAWTQQSGEEVFYKTLREHAWEPPLERVIDEVAREIEG